MTLRNTLALLSLAVPLVAQNGQVAGPRLGFVFDPAAHSVRPVLGIPGASTQGAPLTLGFAPSNTWLAPRQDSAIAVAADGTLHFLRLTDSATEIQCGACPSAADAAIFSPSGTSVALYSAGRVQILTGLPDAPVAGASFNVGLMPRSTRDRVLPPPMALSDDGAWLLASTGSSVNVFSANGGPRSLLATQPFALVAFAPGGHAAVVADETLGFVSFSDVADGSGRRQLAAPGSARKQGALAFSADGSRVVATYPADRSVAVIDAASGSRTDASCDCSLTGLSPMGRVFRLNEPGDGPLWVIDPSATEPRVVFVPAVTQAQ